MKSRSNLIVLFTALICSWSISAIAQEKPVSAPDFSLIERSELLILGTFHFKDPGLDSYRPQHDVNILSQEKQQELSEVIQLLQRFNPTKIAVEYPKARQPQLDSIYSAYQKGRLKDQADEVFQIAMRLAHVLGHPKIYAVDVRGKDYFSDMSDQQWEQKETYFASNVPETLSLHASMIDSLYNALYQHDDFLKTQISLLDFYLYINHESRITRGHGNYMNGGFRWGEGNDYFGPDASTRWYNRNLRIFHNLTSINNPGQDRVFLLMGAGHLPILKFLAETSPDFNKVELSDYVDHQNDE